jgi:hypothetical protein
MQITFACDQIEQAGQDLQLLLGPVSCNATEQAKTVPWLVKALTETGVFLGVVNKCDSSL